MLFNCREEFAKILKTKKLELERLDYELLIKRDKRRYKLIRLAKRCIVSEFGYLKINRRVYFDNFDKKYVKLLDVHLNLNKYVKIDPDLKAKIEDQLGSGKKYKDIIDMFPNAHLSLMTISRIFKSVENDKKRNEVTKKVLLKNNQVVYIFVDDAFLNVDRFRSKKRWKYNRGKDTKVRVISFCTGYDKKTLNLKRKKLANKRNTFLIGKNENISTEALSFKIYELGCNFYENFDNAHLVVGGDGATWIKNLANYLEADYILDRYHAVRELKKVFLNNSIKNSETLFKTALSYFYKGMYEELIQILEIFACNSILKYFKNNVKGIENQNKTWNIGVSAESVVSGLVKSTLGYGSKIFSFKVIKNILNARNFNLNNNLGF
ncbi:hypothetical protein EELLY_v1c03820 [Entomoplasma ellychniae]|uniref:Transposase n=1 Tax=Entomoplasma ellychniae TaxID=2114 RepID=A0A8E2QVZ8_9MOLU|nr:UPF0236 family protein [Entomoplasma ellychniae]PPE04337.1 hypothetical protein EELLY_v1c00110 [Entomoplasma ellychniae]PPE04631.1 hypothetical protein EELLY_v1c03110 [Entomoplasma ellychniae]PPE04702.1 hypothetical protein EELLY_v1c03820 [Entomoplasma ellychniae]